MKNLRIISLLFISSCICAGNNSLPSYDSLISIVENEDSTALKTALGGRHPDSVTGPDDLPLLFYACGSADRIAMTTYLLTHGSDPNTVSEYGTPAHWAAERGDIEQVSLLLEYGFNPRIEGMEYWMEKYNSGADITPEWMREIVEKVHSDSRDYSLYPYMEYTDPASPLLLAAAVYYGNKKNYPAAQRMIDRGITIDLMDSYGMTALLYSVYMLDTAGVAFLIENTADVTMPMHSERMYKQTSDRVYDDDVTPLHLLLHRCKENPAVIDNQKESILRIIDLLLAAGADITAQRRHSGITVLQAAKKLNSPEILAALQAGTQ
ncbi:MAG: ankyrin repeat domain-containing protein [Fibrobacterota bacterium]